MIYFFRRLWYIFNGAFDNFFLALLMCIILALLIGPKNRWLALLIYSQIFCSDCNRGYRSEEEHCCNNICLKCSAQSACVDNVDNLNCTNCSKKFVGIVCLANHKIEIDHKPSICDKFKICPYCSFVTRSVKQKADYVCDMRRGTARNDITS